MNLKRWPIVRHIRYFLLQRRLARWWRSYGRHHFMLINERDLAYLDDVWKGKA